MYFDNLRRMLAGEKVLKVQGLFQVSMDIKFDEGISTCLDYFEAIHWSEYEEEKEFLWLQNIKNGDNFSPSVS